MHERQWDILQDQEDQHVTEADIIVLLVLGNFLLLFQEGKHLRTTLQEMNGFT